MSFARKKFKMNEKNFNTKKIPIKFDITMLNMFIGYLFKKSVQVTRKSLNNMHKFFSIIDESVYDNNEKLEARIYFIKRCLDARVKNSFENENIIIEYCKGDMYSEEIDSIVKNLEIYKKLNYEEIKFVNKTIEDRLCYFYLYNYKDRIYDAVEKLDSGDYDSFKEINSELEGLCRAVINETRKVKVLEDNNTFAIDSDNFLSNITDIYNKLTDPTRILKTGIQYLNKLLSPGYMSKRLYLYMGLPG